MNEMQSIESYVAEILARTPQLRETLKRPEEAVRTAVKQRAIIVPPTFGAAPAAPMAEAAGVEAAEPEAAPALSEEEVRTGARQILGLDGGQPSAEAEAVILLVGRPAMTIELDDFAPMPEHFQDIEDNRSAVTSSFKSVGRIEVVLDTGATMMIGTGFMAGDGLIITNRHVAVAFCQRKGTGFAFKDGMQPQIDFLRENANPNKNIFRIEEALAIHPDTDTDVAVLKLGAPITADATAPPPLKIASEPPQDTDELAPAKQRTIYIVGYPATDNAGTTPVTVLRSIFGSTVRVKRISPGKLTKLTKGRMQLQHDCSTLGGSSGSCVFDLERDQVIGVHFQGVFRTANDAVSAWRFPNDDILKRFSLNFQ